VAGYPRVGRAELSFLEALAGEGSLFVLPFGEAPLFDPNREAARILREAGWQVGARTSDPLTPGERASGSFAGTATPPAAVEALHFPSQEAEVRWALTRVKTLLRRGISEQDIVLAARDDAAYGPLLHAVAWEYRIPVKASYAVPLHDTRIGAWLVALAEVLATGCSFEATARLLANPLTEGLTKEQWARARATHPGNLAAWRELYPGLGILDWPQRESRAAYRARLVDTLEHLSVTTRVTGSGELLALHKIRNALPSLSAPADAVLPLDRFLADLRELLTLLTIPADVGGKGVELHTPLALFGTSYPHVIVLGMAEGKLPAPCTRIPSWITSSAGASLPPACRSSFRRRPHDARPCPSGPCWKAPVRT